jgi:hypothetical protein
LSQLKNLTVSSKTFGPAQKPILLNANHHFVWHKMLATATMKIDFWYGTKKLGPAQNIFGPVKGQGINVYSTCTIITALDYKPWIFLKNFPV